MEESGLVVTKAELAEEEAAIAAVETVFVAKETALVEVAEVEHGVEPAAVAEQQGM